MGLFCDAHFCYFAEQNVKCMKGISASIVTKDQRLTMQSFLWILRHFSAQSDSEPILSEGKKPAPAIVF